MEALASESSAEEQKFKLDSSETSWESIEEQSFHSGSKSSKQSEHSSAKSLDASPLVLHQPSSLPQANKSVKSSDPESSSESNSYGH